MGLPVAGVISALPMILDGVRLFSGLFDEGKAIVEQVTGEAPAAPIETPADLEREVAAMTPDQQAAFVEAMKPRLEFYRAQTDRLRVQGGEISAEILETLPDAARAEVTILRMTTRPWAVRQMVQVIKLPLYLVGIDVAIALVNALTAFGFELFQAARPAPAMDLLGATFFSAESVYYMLYERVVVPATSIVLGYMTLREVGKARDTGAGALAGLVDKAKGLIGKIRG